MKFCVIIPCYNHADTVNGVAASIGEGLGVIVVDDGSSPPVRLENDRCVLVRLEKNGGKAGALKRGFEEAKKLGYTHAVTMDADRQHPPAYLDEFVRAAKTFQHEIILGTRDFDNPAVPRGRRFLNKFSNFWFWVETGVRLGDTQCGYRCYPLAAVDSLNVKFRGFVFEVELLVKAAWAGCRFREVEIPAIYDKQTLAGSHYKPFSDTLKFSLMNTRLCFCRFFLGKAWCRDIALKKK